MLRTQILDLESLDKMRRNNHMFDNLMEQILLSVASQYVPKLQNIACTRANYCYERKDTTSPGEVVR
jgi:hypothetical protein